MRQLILDACCGSRQAWFDKHHPNTIFGDIRDETIAVTDCSNGRSDGVRILHIHPDLQMDFRCLPFADETFRLVFFDPPHLVQVGATSWLFGKYGRLEENWRDDLRSGFAECFRVLKNEGILIFKWSEIQIPLKEVLALSKYQPLFGHKRNMKTHWVCFLKND